MDSIGVDIGGTSIKAALVADDGSVRASSQRPTSPGDPDGIVAQTIELVRELRQHSPDAPVGVAVAAFLDPTRHRVVLSPNISWRDRPLKAELEAALQVTVTLENDANAAGVAEYHVGAGCGASSMVMFTLGTGVGGAVIDRGELLVGAHGVAGELGHLVVEYPGRECGCGLSGCIESIASATAIVRDLREHTGRPELQIPDIEDYLRVDPDFADQIVDRMAQALARGIIQVSAVVDPELVVLGGGLGERLGEILLDRIPRSLTEEFPGRQSTPAELRLAHLGNQAGMVGAAWLARQAVVTRR